MNSIRESMMKEDLSSQREWEELFLKSCRRGHIKTIQSLMGESHRRLWNIHAKGEEGLEWACAEGHLEVVKYLTTCSELNHGGHLFVDIHADEELGFRSACYYGHLDIVKFLTTSPELKEAGHDFANIHAINRYGFRVACENGYVPVVQYLTTSLELQQAGHILGNIDDYNHEGVRLACWNGHVHIVQWLTASDQLKEHGQGWVNINTREGRGGIRNAYELGHWSILEWCMLGLPDERWLDLQVHHMLRSEPKILEWDRIRQEKAMLKDSIQSIKKDEGESVKPISKRI